MAKSAVVSLPCFHCKPQSLMTVSVNLLFITVVGKQLWRIMRLPCSTGLYNRTQTIHFIFHSNKYHSTSLIAVTRWRKLYRKLIRVSWTFVMVSSTSSVLYKFLHWIALFHTRILRPCDQNCEVWLVGCVFSWRHLCHHYCLSCLLWKILVQELAWTCIKFWASVTHITDGMVHILS